MLKKIYQRSIWVDFFPAFLFFFLIGCFFIIVCLLLTKATGKTIGMEEKKIILVGIGFILFSPIFLLISKNFAISIEDESINMYKNIKKKDKAIQIKWKDIIAVYMIKELNIFSFPLHGFSRREKIILIIPRAEIDKADNEAINFEVKTNKEGKRARIYYNWLTTHHKCIEIPKWVKDYRDLLKEIYKRAPHIVIDEEIRKLIEE